MQLFTRRTGIDFRAEFLRVSQASVQQALAKGSQAASIRPKSAWESIAELAGAVAAGLKQAQLDETIRLRQAAERQAEVARQQATARQQAESARQQSAQQQAELSRQQAETARQQAAQRQADTARQKAVDPVSDAEKRAPTSCFAFGSKIEDISENRCPYAIDVTFCSAATTPGFGKTFRCDAQSFGSFGIAANGRATSGLVYSDQPHMIVCRAPYSASNRDMRWDGTHLAGTCR